MLYLGCLAILPIVQLRLLLHSLCLLHSFRRVPSHPNACYSALTHTQKDRHSSNQSRETTPTHQTRDKQTWSCLHRAVDRSSAALWLSLATLTLSCRAFTFFCTAWLGSCSQQSNGHTWTHVYKRFIRRRAAPGLEEGRGGRALKGGQLQSHQRKRVHKSRCGLTLYNKIKYEPIIPTFALMHVSKNRAGKAYHDAVHTM